MFRTITEDLGVVYESSENLDRSFTSFGFGRLRVDADVEEKEACVSVSDKKEIVRQVFEDGFENSSKYTRWIFGEGDHYEL